MAVTRRTLVKLGAGLALGGASTGAYARWLEPASGPLVRSYAFTPGRWTPGLKLRVVCLSDLHCGGAHTPLPRLHRIVEMSHALEPDLICLLGDFVVRERRNVHQVAPRQWAAALGRLKAPLGVHAILGNHEFWDDPVVQLRRGGDPYGKLALLDAGVPVYENRAMRLAKDGRPFWIAGLGDQLAFRVGWSRERGGIYEGRDDLPGTLAQASDEAPLLLMAHEPDIFAGMDPRVSVTLSGHTHGGQINLFGFAPWTPSEYGDRYRHGRVTENGRDLIVSAGLGTSGPPVRLGAPPEIVVLDLG